MISVDLAQRVGEGLAAREETGVHSGTISIACVGQISAQISQPLQ